MSRPVAAQGVAPSFGLSLDAALQRAQARAPEVVLAGHVLREVQARRAGAGIVLPVNPRLALEVRPPFSGEALSAIGYSANLDTLFELGGAPGARVREVARAVELAAADQQYARLSARLYVLERYVSAQLAQLRISETRTGLELAQRVLDAARTRTELGAASDLELTSAQLELARIQAAEHAALREHDQHMMGLREALDLAAAAQLTLTTAVDDPQPLAALPSCVERARRAHPQLLHSRARENALTATRERLEREVFPRMGVYVGVDAAPKSPVFGVLGVSGELPFAQRNQGPLAVSAAELETERDRRALLLRQIEREVTGTWHAYEQRRAELEVLSGSALPAAVRSFELAEAGWRAGRFDWFRVAYAARDLVEVRARRLEALTALWTQRIFFLRAMGGETP